jgi:hypothetical protein
VDLGWAKKTTVERLALNQQNEQIYKIPKGKNTAHRVNILPNLIYTLFFIKAITDIYNNKNKQKNFFQVFVPSD